MLGFLFRIVTVFVSALVTKLDLSGLPQSRFPHKPCYILHTILQTQDFFKNFVIAQAVTSLYLQFATHNSMCFVYILNSVFTAT